MRSLAFGLVLATTIGATVCSAQPASEPGRRTPAGAQVSVGYNVFYDALSPYGSWLDLDPWGQVWQPAMTPAGWRPYTMGHWVYSNDSWTWISDFEWGWAAFHYGRWFFDPYYGWVWIPGDVWGPAWVAWRWGDGFVGWAPVPAWVGWEMGVGFTIGDFDSLIPEHDWVFCGARDLDRPHLRELLFPERNNDRYLGRTHDVTDFASVRDRVVDRSIAADLIARANGRTVPRFRLMERRLPGPTQVRERNQEVELYRPRFIARGGNGAGAFDGGRGARTSPSTEEMRSFRELLQQQEEAQQLRQRQEAEHRAMAERQQREAAHPGRLQPKQIRQRQEAERHQLEQRQTEERRAMQERFARERRQAESPHEPHARPHHESHARPHQPGR
jgi:hypothetical protein